MANNILRAILNIATFGNNDLKSYASTYLNRINAVGEQLEFYIKDSIANSLKLPQDKNRAGRAAFRSGHGRRAPGCRHSADSDRHQRGAGD